MTATRDEPSDGDRDAVEQTPINEPVATRCPIELLVELMRFEAKCKSKRRPKKKRRNLRGTGRRRS